jgi:hypothetical protein
MTFALVLDHDGSVSVNLCLASQAGVKSQTDSDSLQALLLVLFDLGQVIIPCFHDHVTGRAGAKSAAKK